MSSSSSSTEVQGLHDETASSDRSDPAWLEDACSIMVHIAGTFGHVNSLYEQLIGRQVYKQALSRLSRASYTSVVCHSNISSS
jgi:hypothetical protein